jgi:hypothetical protein
MQPLPFRTWIVETLENVYKAYASDISAYEQLVRYFDQCPNVL